MSWDNNSLGPKKICTILASRIYFSTGYSFEYPYDPMTWTHWVVTSMAVLVENT